MRALMVGLLAAIAWPAAPQDAGPAPPQIVSRLVRTPPAGLLGPRVPIETESEFLTTDPVVYDLVTWTGGRKDDKLRVEWHDPSGALVQKNEHTQTTEAGPPRLLWKLVIAGAPAATTPGDWQVQLFWNDRSVAVNHFKISPPPDSAINIATRTVLPSATVGVPYFLQLTARGGKPPYRWSAAGSLPAGIAFSESGTLTGSAQRRGTYRVVLDAKDSAGNAVTRTFGLTVGPVAMTTVKSPFHALLPAAGPDPCSQSGSQSRFSASDPFIVLAATLQAPRGREGRVEWLNPRGEIMQEDRVSLAAERQECIVKVLPVVRHRAAQEAGDWRVRLFWADAEVFTLNFTLTPRRSEGGRAAPAPSAPARSGRLAILIANQRYQKLPPGKFALADLDVLASALRADGFEVVRVFDASLEALRQVEETLAGKLQAGDTALVYYAGYDARAGGDDWLLPVNFDPAAAGPMQTRGYSAVRLLQWLEDSKATLRFVLLDSAPPEGQPAENPGAVLGEVDESTALVYSRGGTPGALPRALAEAAGRAGEDARTVLGVELPKAAARLSPGAPAPVAIIGGGADFVFRPTAQ